MKANGSDETMMIDMLADIVAAATIMSEADGDNEDLFGNRMELRHWITWLGHQDTFYNWEFSDHWIDLAFELGQYWAEEWMAENMDGDDE